MSLERAIQDLTQSVNLLMRAIDLNTATLAESSQANMAATAEQQERSAAAEQNRTNSAPQAAPQKEATPDPKQDIEQDVEVTDEYVKTSSEFQRVVNAMREYQRVATMRNGGNADEAKADTIKLLKTYADDGKVMSFVRAIIETGNTEVLEEFDKFMKDKTTELEQNAQEASEQAEQAEQVEQATPAEQETTQTEQREYTAEDVKEALRKYASVEGRPAALAMLKKQTGFTAVKDVGPLDYERVVKALKV